MPRTGSGAGLGTATATATRLIQSLWLLAFTLLCGCSLLPREAPFKPARFSDLQGWNTEQASGMTRALLNSCELYQQRSGPVSDNPLFGTYEQWHPICETLPVLEPDALTGFFEQEFQVYRIAPWQPGLFTGYYTPLVHGSRQHSQRYPVPLLEVPDDLIRFNPKDFSLERANDKPWRLLSAKINNGWMVPYDDRENINQRAANGDYDDQVLFWLDSRVDRFFLQIQGSGTVRLDTGEDIQVRISGRNGQDYFAIGRYMKQQGMLDQVSMQSIRQWLDNNPERQDEVFHTNPDFIFFSLQEKSGPIGAQGTQLIPEHSAAVDDDVIPLGTPLWLSTTLTADGDQPFSRAMVAQDIGSAIKGEVRADIFFGAGKEAAHKAGYQNGNGKLFILTPKQTTHTE